MNTLQQYGNTIRDMNILQQYGNSIRDTNTLQQYGNSIRDMNTLQELGIPKERQIKIKSYYLHTYTNATTAFL